MSPEDVADLATLDRLRSLVLLQTGFTDGDLAKLVECQNYPRTLSLPFRVGLVEIIRRWNAWALNLSESGHSDAVATELGIEINVIRIGDVGIVGMSCEPFQEIGRQIRRVSPLPISVPCGYTNVSHGYITDSGNTGDQEYMSAHYRYTKPTPRSVACARW